MPGMQRNTIQSYSLLRMEILPPSIIILCDWFKVRGQGYLKGIADLAAYGS
jgi:hypothetical protein